MPCLQLAQRYGRNKLGEKIGQLSSVLRALALLSPLSQAKERAEAAHITRFCYNPCRSRFLERWAACDADLAHASRRRAAGLGGPRGGSLLTTTVERIQWVFSAATRAGGSRHGRQ